MAYTETKTTNYGQRLSGSLKGIISGLLMFIVGTCLLWWNEGRAVKTAKGIKEAQSVAVHVDDVSSVDASFNGKLIHASAFADTKDTLSDDFLGVRELAVKLNRKVEYYQWVENTKTEKRDRIGGSEETVTTYTYEMKWVNAPVASSEFKDEQYRNRNFVLTQMEDKEQMAPNVTFGAYTLPDFLKRRISGDVPATVKMTDEQIQEWNKELRSSNNLNESASKDSISNDSISLVHVSNNVVYFGRSSKKPQVGDVRITFNKVMPADISLIAKVNGSTFEEYTAKNGSSFSRLEMGQKSAENMFEHAHDENRTLTWILRLVGVLLVIFGLKTMFSILPTLFKVLPFLADIVNLGVGLVCSVLGLVWSLLVIGVAWLFYRPLLGITLVVLAVGGIIFLKQRSKKETDSSSIPSSSSSK